MSERIFVGNVRGQQGVQGETGLTGKTGTTFTPTVDSDGNLSWTNDGGAENPETVNIKGETGAQGETGAAAGFGSVTATVDSTTGTPAVTVTASGPDTAKRFAFAFSGLKGADGAGMDALNPPVTASGDIVTFTSEAAGNPVNPLMVSIAPVQSGSGDPSPENVCPITGWTGATIGRCGANLISTLNNVTWSGITAQNLGNGQLRIYGEYTGSSSSGRVLCSIPAESVSGGSLTLGALPSIPNTRFYIYDRTDSATIENPIATAGVFTPAANHNIALAMYASPGAKFDVTFTPAIYETAAADVASVAFPDSAGTVYGGTLDVARGKLTVTDANIASYAGETLPGAWISDRDVYPTKNLLRITAATQTVNGVTFTVDQAAGTVTASGTATGSYANISLGEFTVQAGAYSVSGCPEGGSQSTYSVRTFAPDDTAYRNTFEDGRSLSISKAGTLRADIIIREGVTVSNLVFRPMIRLASETDSTFEPFKPTTGAQVVYKLATPLTYQLTPRQVTALLGANTVWADCGGVDVTYRSGTGSPVLTAAELGVAGGAAAYDDVMDRLAALEAAVLSLGGNI